MIHATAARAALVTGALILLAAAITFPQYVLCALWIVVICATADGRRHRNPRLWKK